MTRVQMLQLTAAVVTIAAYLGIPKAHADGWARCGEVNIGYTEGGSDVEMVRKADTQALHQSVIGNICSTLGLRGLPVFPDAHKGWVSIIGYDTWALGGWQFRLVSTAKPWDHPPQP